jgi:ABC-type antimicrobial peptide transport system permease subunit
LLSCSCIESLIIGVRLALGADRGRVVAMVLREAMALTAVGAAAGLVGALAAGRALRSLLYDLAPADPWTYAGTVAVLALAAAAAALVPAARAARASPLEAIRAVE